MSDRPLGPPASTPGLAHPRATPTHATSSQHPASAAGNGPALFSGTPTSLSQSLPTAPMPASLPHSASLTSSLVPVSAAGQPGFGPAPHPSSGDPPRAVRSSAALSGPLTVLATSSLPRPTIFMVHPGGGPHTPFSPATTNPGASVLTASGGNAGLGGGSLASNTAQVTGLSPLPTSALIRGAAVGGVRPGVVPRHSASATLSEAPSFSTQVTEDGLLYAGSSRPSSVANPAVNAAAFAANAAAIAASNSGTGAASASSAAAPGAGLSASAGAVPTLHRGGSAPGAPPALLLSASASAAGAGSGPGSGPAPLSGPAGPGAAGPGAAMGATPGAGTMAASTIGVGAFSSRPPTPSRYNSAAAAAVHPHMLMSDAQLQLQQQQQYQLQYNQHYVLQQHQQQALAAATAAAAAQQRQQARFVVATPAPFSQHNQQQQQPQQQQQQQQNGGHAAAPATGAVSVPLPTHGALSASADMYDTSASPAAPAAAAAVAPTPTPGVGATAGAGGAVQPILRPAPKRGDSAMATGALAAGALAGVASGTTTPVLNSGGNAGGAAVGAARLGGAGYLLHQQPQPQQSGAQKLAPGAGAAAAGNGGNGGGGGGGGAGAASGSLLTPSPPPASAAALALAQAQAQAAQLRQQRQLQQHQQQTPQPQAMGGEQMTAGLSGLVLIQKLEDQARTETTSALARGPAAQAHAHSHGLGNGQAFATEYNVGYGQLPHSQLQQQQQQQQMQLQQQHQQQLQMQLQQQQLQREQQRDVVDVDVSGYHPAGAATVTTDGSGNPYSPSAGAAAYYDGNGAMGEYGHINQHHMQQQQLQYQQEQEQQQLHQQQHMQMQYHAQQQQQLHEQHQFEQQQQQQHAAPPMTLDQAFIAQHGDVIGGLSSLGIGLGTSRIYRPAFRGPTNLLGRLTVHLMHTLSDINTRHYAAASEKNPQARDAVQAAAAAQSASLATAQQQFDRKQRRRARDAGTGGDAAERERARRPAMSASVAAALAAEGKGGDGDEAAHAGLNRSHHGHGHGHAGGGGANKESDSQHHEYASAELQALPPQPWGPDATLEQFAAHGRSRAQSHSHQHQQQQQQQQQQQFQEQEQSQQKEDAHVQLPLPRAPLPASASAAATGMVLVAPGSVAASGSLPSAASNPQQQQQQQAEDPAVTAAAMARAEARARHHAAQQQQQQQQQQRQQRKGGNGATGAETGDGAAAEVDESAYRALPGGYCSGGRFNQYLGDPYQPPPRVLTGRMRVEGGPPPFAQAAATFARLAELHDCQERAVRADLARTSDALPPALKRAEANKAAALAAAAASGGPAPSPVPELVPPRAMAPSGVDVTGDATGAAAGSADGGVALTRGTLLGDGRYCIEATIGRGSFGRVVRAFDGVAQRHVAIKVISALPLFAEQAQMELRVLTSLRAMGFDLDTVTVLDAFFHHGHQCIVLELLGQSLFDLLRHHKFRGFGIRAVSVWAHSLLMTLHKLAHAPCLYSRMLRVSSRPGIIHCDIKPENILVASQHQQSAIRLIDFGSACYHREQSYTYIQSRFYRAPEVIMAAPYTCAIDMWSLGCVLFELATGAPLFPGNNESDQVVRHFQTLGPPPARLVLQSKKGQRYFAVDGARVTLRPEYHHLLQPEDKVTKIEAQIDAIPEVTDIEKTLFLQLLSGMLAYSPSERIAPMQALRHAFFTLYALPVPFIDLSHLHAPDVTRALFRSARTCRIMQVLLSSKAAAVAAANAANAITDASDTSASKDGNAANASNSSALTALAPDSRATAAGGAAGGLKRLKEAQGYLEHARRLQRQADDIAAASLPLISGGQLPADAGLPAVTTVTGAMPGEAQLLQPSAEPPFRGGAHFGSAFGGLAAGTLPASASLPNPFSSTAAAAANNAVPSLFQAQQQAQQQFASRFGIGVSAFPASTSNPTTIASAAAHPRPSTPNASSNATGRFAMAGTPLTAVTQSVRHLSLAERPVATAAGAPPLYPGQQPLQHQQQQQQQHLQGLHHRLMPRASPDQRPQQQ